MTPELEKQLHPIFQKHYDELLQRGRREAYGDDHAESEAPMGGEVAFTAACEGYELFLSYTSEPDEDLELIGGRKL